MNDPNDPFFIHPPILPYSQASMASRELTRSGVLAIITMAFLLICCFVFPVMIPRDASDYDFYDFLGYCVPSVFTGIGILAGLHAVRAASSRDRMAGWITLIVAALLGTFMLTDRVMHL